MEDESLGQEKDVWQLNLDFQGRTIKERRKKDISINYVNKNGNNRKTCFKEFRENIGVCSKGSKRGK